MSVDRDKKFDLSQGAVKRGEFYLPSPNPQLRETLDKFYGVNSEELYREAVIQDLWPPLDKTLNEVWKESQKS